MMKMFVLIRFCRKNDKPNRRIHLIVPIRLTFCQKSYCQLQSEFCMIVLELLIDKSCAEKVKNVNHNCCQMLYDMSK